VFVIGDGRLGYGDIVTVIDVAKGAGVVQVGIVTEERARDGELEPPESREPENP
jgi:biopolymer transport protein ExbD